MESAKNIADLVMN